MFYFLLSMYLKLHNLGLRQFSSMAHAGGAIDFSAFPEIFYNSCPIVYKKIIFYNHTAIK